MLVELTVEDVDAKRPAAPLFVRCQREEDGPAPSLSVEVVEAPRVWQARVGPADKPKALDCLSAEFLATLERALGGGGADDDADAVSAAPRFRLRWSRSTRTLTLMEQSAGGFAMKYAALTLGDHLAKQEEEEDGQLEVYWRELLRGVVGERASLATALAQREGRVEELEALVRAKDALLEQALEAKQRGQDAVVSGCCAVLNAKKDEIRRLQSELAAASARAGGGQPASTTGQKVSAKKKLARGTGVKRLRATRGAKLAQKQEEKEEKEEEEEFDEGSRQSSDGGNDGEADDEDVKRGAGGRKRARRDAIDAYSQLPSAMQPATQRVCSSDDVMSDVGALLKREIAAEKASAQASKSTAASLHAETKQATLDSDEEDIFDILG